MKQSIYITLYNGIPVSAVLDRLKEAGVKPEDATLDIDECYDWTPEGRVLVKEIRIVWEPEKANPPK